jgi:hypothetical protein
VDAAHAREVLASAKDDDPVALPPSVLSELTVDDLPEGISVQIGIMKDRVLHLDWSGTLFREGDAIFGEADHTWKMALH